MSIYVYITRRRNPIEDTGPVVGELEWLSAIEGDPTFRRPSREEVGKERRSPSSYAVWTAHPEGHDTWFIWTNGQIDIKNPDEPMIAKAISIAARLGAQVVSEMGELFNEDGSHRGFVDGEPW
ncbi:MAG: hypothetical protein ACREH4_03550 [Vitreimonas sp.]